MRESFRLMQKNREIGNADNYMSLIFIGHEKALGKNLNEINKIIKKLLGDL